MRENDRPNHDGGADPVAVDVSDILNSNEALERKVHLIIERYAFTAGVLACQPFPIADFFILTPLEIGMAVHLASLRGIRLLHPETDVPQMLQEVGWTYGLAVLAKNAVLSLYKFVPYLGVLTTVPMVFSVVYAMGHVIDGYLAAKARGETVTAGVLRTVYEQKLESGKKLGRERFEAIREAARRRTSRGASRT